MLFIWSLSYKWYNPYFTGLIRDVAPWAIPQSYADKCKAYLYEELPITYEKGWGIEVDPEEFPVPFNKLDQGEFWPDMQQKVVKQFCFKSLSGLGWFAAAAMIDLEEAKEFMNELHTC
jgi:hypothetical protein